jgi:molybdate transport system substrate-binding protein
VTLGYMKLVYIAVTAVLGVAMANAQTTLKVAAAADLQPVLPAIAQAYEKETGVKLQVSFGSSATLATQIINGAPFDIFLAADFSFPEQVIAAGLAAGKDPIAYATGTLVVFARKDSPIQPLNIDKLTDPAITRIAVADEAHAPYGRAAYQVMRSMKTLDTLKPKLVVAENIAQTAQFVVSGNAQVGFISLTSAQTPQMKEIGTYVLAPLVYNKLKQCAVVMKSSPNLEATQKFLTWLTSEKIQSHLKDFGLDPAS